MCNQPLSIHQKFILFGLATEDGMVFENETFCIGPSLPLKEQRRCQAADSAANDHAIIDLAGFDNLLWKWIVPPIADRVTRAQDIESVAV